MRLLLGVLIVLLVLALTVKASSRPVKPSRDPVVIDVISLTEISAPANSPSDIVRDMPGGPSSASPFDEGVLRQLDVGPPPPVSLRPYPAGTVPGPDPPRPVGQLLEHNTGPPTYGAAGQDAYCPDSLR